MGSDLTSAHKSPSQGLVSNLKLAHCIPQCSASLSVSSVEVTFFPCNYVPCAPIQLHLTSHSPCSTVPHGSHCWLLSEMATDHVQAHRPTMLRRSWAWQASTTFLLSGVSTWVPHTVVLPGSSSPVIMNAKSQSGQGLKSTSLPAAQRWSRIWP